MCLRVKFETWMFQSTEHYIKQNIYLSSSGKLPSESNSMNNKNGS